MGCAESVEETVTPRNITIGNTPSQPRDQPPVQPSEPPPVQPSEPPIVQANDPQPIGAPGNITANMEFSGQDG